MNKKEEIDALSNMIANINSSIYTLWMARIRAGALEDEQYVNNLKKQTKILDTYISELQKRLDKLLME